MFLNFENKLTELDHIKIDMSVRSRFIYYFEKLKTDYTIHCYSYNKEKITHENHDETFLITKLETVTKDFKFLWLWTYKTVEYNTYSIYADISTGYGDILKFRIFGRDAIDNVIPIIKTWAVDNEHKIEINVQNVQKCVELREHFKLPWWTSKWIRVKLK